ncbi:hypothetical protein [uncultured Ruegeria sp.]|uniref:hypothetical protein n=1 Tax=uncultured Ruegeria sp. TaxID=259304 RepID=UPI0026086BED|nr:hypothetical protein [uncultured Ruegeria sp.]
MAVAPTVYNGFERDLLMIIRLVLAAALILILPLVSVAQDLSKDQLLAELTFDDLDQHGNGFIHLGHVEEFRQFVFGSMDQDEDGHLNIEEWVRWDYGFRVLSTELDRVEAYETALKVMFAVADRNGDELVSETEHRKNSLAAFERADLNNDELLTEDEYLGGFTILVAIRAALQPDD